MRRIFAVVPILWVISTIGSAQVPSPAAPEHAAETDTEAGAVLAAAQEQIRNLPDAKKQQVLNGFGEIVRNKLGVVATATMDLHDPATILKVDPKKLTLQQKNELLSLIQQTQQVVDPTLVPSPTTSQDPQDILSVFSSSAPLTPAEVALYSNNVKKLPTVAASVGRLLWANKIDQKWNFEGTVFVTKTNVVATACHVIEPLVDVSNGSISLRNDRIAVVDFSDNLFPVPGVIPPGVHTYAVVNIIATGSGQGCDVALLRLSGAEGIAPLKVSDDATRLPKRVVVVGYPQLTDLSDLVCQYTIDKTTKYFCDFHQAHPTVAKVKSPGSTYTSNAHDGIDVFTYNASTRGGQSGSPVIDLDSLRVVGVHYCCTGSSQVDTVLGCATWHAQDLRWNEAISAKTLIGDKALKDYFEISHQSLAQLKSADTDTHALRSFP